MTSLAESLLEVVRKQRDLMQALSEHIKAISVRVTSRDQSVSAEVGPTGELTGLWLQPQAAQLGADALAKLIVETAQAAAQVALDRQNYLFSEFNARMEQLNKTPLTCWDGSTFVRGQPTQG